MGQYDEAIKHAADASAIAILIATLANWLPGIAALLTVLWLAVRLYNEIMTTIDRRRRLKMLLAKHLFQNQKKD